MPAKKSRPPSRYRHLIPGAVVHVGSRTARGQFLLSPGDKPDTFFKRCVGLMHTAREKYGVDVISVVILSNHLHMQLRARRARSISLFMQYVKAGIADLVHETHGTSGSVWGERFSSTNSMDTESEQYWLRYIGSHSVKEGLLSDPGLWPGLHSIDALRTGAPLEGLVLDSKAYKAARRRDPKARKADHLNPVELPLAPLSDWKTDPTGYRTWCNQIIDDIIASHAGLPTTGLDAILARRHTHTPALLKRSIAYCFDARGPDAQALLEECYAHRRAVNAGADESYDRLIRDPHDLDALYLDPALQWPPLIARLLDDPVQSAEPGPTQIHPDDRLPAERRSTQVVA